MSISDDFDYLVSFVPRYRAQAGAHIHTKSFYNAYQFKMYVIFYLVLLSNFNFVHMTKMAAFSTQNQEKKEIKSSIETDKLWLDLFILHITNWIIAYDDYLLNELQLCSAKRSQFFCTVHFFDSSVRLSLFLSFSPFKNIMWTKFINKSMNERTFEWVIACIKTFVWSPPDLMTGRSIWWLDLR